MGLGLREAVDAGDVVLDLEGLGDEARVASLVDVADVGAGAVGVDLVDGHGYFAAGLDLGDGADGEGVLGVFADVDVAGQLGPPALVDDVGEDLGVADDGGVHLAGVDGGAVARDGIVDLEADGQGRAGVSLGAKNHAVGLGQGQEGRKRQEGRCSVHYRSEGGGTAWKKETNEENGKPGETNGERVMLEISRTQVGQPDGIYTHPKSELAPCVEFNPWVHHL